MAVNDMEPNMRPFTLKTGLFLTLILAFLLVNIGVADAQSRRTCPALTKRIEISVKTISRNIDYDLSVTQPQLRRLANRSASSRVSPNERALGLTSSGHSVAYQTKSQVARLGRNRYCARIQTADVEILVTRLKVYILNKYRRGSCQYAAILDHEHEHVAAFQNSIATLERAFNDRIWRIVKNLSPAFGTSSKIASQGALRNLGARLNRIKSPIERRMITHNRQIDTPLSYQRLVQQCSKW